MADDEGLPTEIKFHSPLAGVFLKGTDFFSTWSTQRAVRSDAPAAVTDKEDAIQFERLLEKDIERVDITNARKHIIGEYKSVVNGLQNTYIVSFSELRLIHEKLGADKTLLNKHNTEMSLEELKQYQSFLQQIQDIVDKARQAYINDAMKSTEGHQMVLGELKTTFWYRFFRRFMPTMMEQYSFWSLGRKTVREEKKLVSLDEAKNAGKKIHEILITNKKYAEHFEKITEGMFRFSILLIQNGFKSAKLIEKAVAEYNLPPAYGLFAKRLLKIIQQDEKGALKSLEKCLIQVKNLAAEVHDMVEDKIREHQKLEKLAA